MVKIKIRCVSHHAPNEILEVTEKLVAGLLATGQYELVDKPKEVKSKKVSKYVEELTAETENLNEPKLFD